MRFHQDKMNGRLLTIVTPIAGPILHYPASTPVEMINCVFTKEILLLLYKMPKFFQCEVLKWTVQHSAGVDLVLMMIRPDRLDSTQVNILVRKRGKKPKADNTVIDHND